LERFISLFRFNLASLPSSAFRFRQPAPVSTETREFFRVLFKYTNHLAIIHAVVRYTSKWKSSLLYKGNEYDRVFEHYEQGATYADYYSATVDAGLLAPGSGRKRRDRAGA
jgi:hypothetical protein